MKGSTQLTPQTEGLQSKPLPILSWAWPAQPLCAARNPARALLIRWLALSWLALWSCPTTLTGAELHPVLLAWFETQTNIHTWSAKVTQTRNLKTLTQPLRAHGRVWFAAPSRFRWEIGQPPKTIALRQAEELLVIYPGLKRAERYSLADREAGPWKETLGLMDAGFPRSQADLLARFRIISQTVSNQVCQLGLQPKSASARRLMPQIKIFFATNDLSLSATELEFTDGSTMRNDFSDQRLNARLDEALFHYPLPADYEVVEPLKK